MKLFPLILAALLVTAGEECRATTRVYDITRFGAVASDGKDDTAAVLAALKECRNSPKSKLVFPRGTYNFSAGANPNSPNYLFNLEGYSHLTIDGGGSQFVISGLTGVFRLTGCKSTTLANFSIDWDRPPFSVGEVIEAEGDRFDVRVRDAYPVKGGEGIAAFMDYDPKTRIPVRQGLDEYGTVDRTELLHLSPKRLPLHRLYRSEAQEDQRLYSAGDGVRRRALHESTHGAVQHPYQAGHRPPDVYDRRLGPPARRQGQHHHQGLPVRGDG